jgi:hypothetical protein
MGTPQSEKNVAFTQFFELKFCGFGKNHYLCRDIFQLFINSLQNQILRK